MLMVRFTRENSWFWLPQNTLKYLQVSLKISEGVNPTVVDCLAALLAIKTNNVTSRSFLTNWLTFTFLKDFASITMIERSTLWWFEGFTDLKMCLQWECLSPIEVTEELSCQTLWNIKKAAQQRPTAPRNNQPGSNNNPTITTWKDSR